MNQTSTPHTRKNATYAVKDGSCLLDRCLKRLFDFVLALLALILSSPFFLLFALLIKREDGGPAIYKQERIGLKGKAFLIYKFRSMKVDAEADGPELCHEEKSKDPRLTVVGAFLRHHHLDELPQLWNVFKGDMAFVGPRPERQFFIDKIVEQDPRYTSLYQIRPGVTSHATLYNGYTDTMEKMLKRLEYDLAYLSHHNIFIDAGLLAKTFSSIVFGKRF